MEAYMAIGNQTHPEKLQCIALNLCSLKITQEQPESH